MLLIFSWIPAGAAEPPAAMQTFWASDQSQSMYADGTGLFTPQQRRIWIGKDSVRSEYLLGGGMFEGDPSLLAGLRCSLEGKILKHRTGDPDEEDGIVQIGIMLVQVEKAGQSTFAGAPAKGEAAHPKWAAKPGEFTTLFYALHADGWAEIDMHPGNTVSKAEVTEDYDREIGWSHLDEWGVDPEKCQRFESKKRLESLWKLKRIDYRDAAEVSRIVIVYQVEAFLNPDVKMGYEVFYCQVQNDYLIGQGYNPFVGRIALSHADGFIRGSLWESLNAFESELARLVTGKPDSVPAGAAKVKAWTEQVRAAIAAGDLKSVMQLYHWDGVDPAIRQEHARRWQGLFATVKDDLPKLKIEVLDPGNVLFDDRSFENDGRRYRQNLPSTAALRISLPEKYAYAELTWPVGLTESDKMVLTSPMRVPDPAQKPDRQDGKPSDKPAAKLPESIDDLKGRLQSALNDGDFAALEALYDWDDAPRFIQDREHAAWRQLREPAGKWSQALKARAKKITDPEDAKEYLESVLGDPDAPRMAIGVKHSGRILVDAKQRELLTKEELVAHEYEFPGLAASFLIELGIEDSSPLAGTLRHQVLIAKQPDGRFALVPVRWPFVPLWWQ